MGGKKAELIKRLEAYDAGRSVLPDVGTPVSNIPPLSVRSQGEIHLSSAEPSARRTRVRSGEGVDGQAEASKRRRS
jgi:hypothetical protein